MQTKSGDNEKNKCEVFKKKLYTDDNIISEGLIPLMKNDKLFNDMYRNINYSGSYFKGTKVGKPDEYDLNLILRLPIDYNTVQIDADHKYYGYIKIKIGQESRLKKWEEHRKVLDKWLNENGYLIQDLFYRWMDRIMTITTNQLTKNGKLFELEVANKKYLLKPIKKSGPSFTVFIVKSEESASEEVISIDLAPCLEFNNIGLKKYRVMEKMAPKFLVVAKSSEENDREGNVLWRLSFYEQERLYLLKSECGKMKPIIRMIKKFRDNRSWKKIASYYIETLFLNELAAREADTDFFRAPKTGLFIHMLCKLWEALEAKNLPYFWNQHHNLLAKIDPIVLTNYANQLKAILGIIEKNIPNDKFVIADQILTQAEGEHLRETMNKGLGINTVENEKRLRRATSEPPQSITLRTDSSNKCDINSRIDQLCNNLNEFSKTKHTLSQEKLQKIYEACKNFLETRENQDFMYSGFCAFASK